MDAKLLKLKNSMGSSPVHDDFDDDDDYTSDDMNGTDEMQSDPEYDDDESRTGNNKSKRLKSYNNNNDERFRNRTKSTANESKSSIRRMPTRKPDPKISNRNAIMARENRRKKKEHMEVLQKTVDDTQNENKKLRKMLSIRNNTIHKLTQESLYLRSILANKTEIMSLLRCIQGNRTPITSSVLSFVADQDYRDQSPHHHTTVPSPIRTISNSSSGCSPASSMSPSSYIEDDKENGTVWATNTDPFLSSFTESQNPFIFTDLESISNDFNTADHFKWENLLSEPTTTFKNNDLSTLNIPDLRDIDDSEILSTNSSNTVKIEHNYFNNPITNNNVKVAEKNDAASTPGVCLHVSQGRVSLEFCATCHLNSQNAWCEEM